MSEAVRLPATLPGDLDLAALNARLRAGSAALDWSDVTEASGDALAPLLAGLDLSEDADALGLETVPDALTAAVEAALTAKAPARKERKKKAVAAAPGSEPALWAPPAGAASAPVKEAVEEVVEPWDATLPPLASPAAPPTPPRVLRKLSGTAIRDELVQRILLELHGPAGGPEEEVAEQYVSDRYLVGALAPRDRKLRAEEMDRVEEGGDGEDEDGKPDAGSVGKSLLLPSSFGLTFAVDGAASSFVATVRWGRYQREESPTLVSEKTGRPVKVWRREPVVRSFSLALAEGAIGPVAPFEETPAVVVQGTARRHGGAWLVSLFLVNGQRTPPKGSPRGRDSAWLFQASLEVAGEDGAAVFVRRGADGARARLLDERMTEMLYRDAVELAVGHGVGVHWELKPGDPHRAVRIETRAVPRYEVPSSTPPSAVEIPGLAGLTLDMKELSECAADDLPARLLPLAEAYGAWIAGAEERVGQAEASLGVFPGETAEAVAGCRRAEARIREGIALLAKDPLAADAFRFANGAMWRQRIHSKLTERVRRGAPTKLEELDVPRNRSWYPFQLAFLLLNLPGATDLGHPDRVGGGAATADLLWFPTGGGKTEAYLGLAAYVMGLRRRQGPIEGRDGEAGLAVLMRYTLRLLTLQQFQRAAALVCACEEIRREALAKDDARWGRTPFRIGLWVGKRVTPNTTEQAAESVRRSRGVGAFHGSSGTPCQLLTCPWCGHEVKSGRDVTVEPYPGGRARTLQYCGDPLGRCLFSKAKSQGEGLPILVVDEEIYRQPPSLLVATVDKFAQMPWNGAIQTLFGQVSGRCERHGFRSPDLNDADSHHATPTNPKARTVASPALRPPDLVIQDELHLISGPLGTLVGLYETAVDRLSSWTVNGKTVRPKLVASTATIRRAADQTFALFHRKVEIFPPQGIDVADSFFSRRRAPSEEVPGRLYLGLCAPGKRMKAALIRAYTAAMAAAQSLYEECGEDADPWMTAVGYFGSMRELGGMRRVVEDEIQSRLLKMDRRGLAKRRIQPATLEELTSRCSSTDIPKILDRLEVKFPGHGLPPVTGRPRPLDVVLATNMVSVGVDVQRLGLMLVCGQPKSTAEYIQATSRVGRLHPGLVVTVFNWTRPRDLSHYESFEHYHATFHKHVEALSVTPFAPRALDRAVFAVLASLVRLGAARFNPNDAAGSVKASEALVAEAVEAIAERVHGVTSKAQVAEAVREILRSRLDQWEATAAMGGADLAWRRVTNRRGLLRPPSEEPWGEFTCLNSLRDVEPTSALLLVDDEGLDAGRNFVAKPPETEPPGDDDDGDDEEVA